MERDVTVREMMTREYVGVSESDDVLGAVRLMREERAGSALVLRGSEPVGILTEWDVLGLVADEADPSETSVSERMSEPVLSVTADRTVTDAAQLMSRESVRRLLVEGDDDDVLGVLTDRDVIAATGSSTALTDVPTEDPVGNPSSDRRVTQDGGNDGYSVQGICEVCGSLTRSLGNFNGQLICSDCREV